MEQKKMIEEETLEKPEDEEDVGMLQQMANAIRVKREKFFNQYKKVA